MVCRNIVYRTKANIREVREQYPGWKAENTLIQVFSGVLNQKIIRKLQQELNEIFPLAPVMGMSTAGEILEGRFSENSIVLSFCFFDTTRVKTYLVDQNDNLYAAGTLMGKELSQDRIKAVILFGCGLKEEKFINSEPLLAGIKDSLGDVLIAGGQAGDNGIGQRTFVFTREQITEHGAVGASLSGSDLRAGHAFNLSWIPIGKKLEITEAEGNHVISIENQTPYDLYSYYLGEEIARDLPLAGAEFPLMIDRKGLNVAIHPMKIHPDGTFDYIHNFEKGEKVQFCYCNAGLISLGAEKLRHEIRALQPQAIFLYACVSRKWVLGADISMDLSAVKQISHSAGSYCYGEYYSHENSQTYMFSQTQTALSLSESHLEGTAHDAPEVSRTYPEESRQFRTMRVLHRLVETSTREIESINTELVTLTRQDPLTKLANRRYLDEKLRMEIKRHSRSGNPLSLILMDVDFFKNYNDSYGHVQGDEVLQTLGQLIKRIVRRPDDLAARYGGEEFTCLLSETPPEGAGIIAEKLRREVEDLMIPHKTSAVSDYLTISLGVYTTFCDKETLNKDLFRICDTILYKAKGSGRNCLVQEANI